MEGQNTQLPTQPQQQAPAVILVQQPVILGPGTLVRGYPFLRRGVKLNNGTKIGAMSISFLGTFGVVFLFIGLILAASGVSAFIGILLMIIGGGMTAVCFKFCHKAKQDYDALPQDHPDRITYSTPVFRPNRGGRGFTGDAYHLQPGMQIITAQNVQASGQLLANYQLPPGTQLVSPSAAVHQSSSSSYPGSHLNQQLGFPPATSQYHQFSPEEDKPPSYDEVCKNES